MIVITGASDGLGRELSNLFAESGKTVVNISRRANDRAKYNIQTDLRNDISIKDAAQQILDIDEPLEALINAAGVMSLEEVEKITPEQLDAVLETNVRGPILLISALMERIKHDGADIVNVASTVGTKGYVSQTAYGASKWAMRGISANLQVELKDTKCRVISFCTGGFESKIFEKATGVKNQDFTHWMKAKDVALCLKQLLDLPKNMEVSEIIINRKAIN